MRRLHPAGFGAPRDNDPIGNRLTYAAGTQQPATYTSNPLNQYTQVDQPTAGTPLVQSFEWDADGNLTNSWAAGDMNCDGVVNFADINAFVLALNGQAGYETAYPNCNWLNADVNGDGLVNFADINLFVSLLSGS